jgi:subtilase family serine protease
MLIMGMLLIMSCLQTEHRLALTKEHSAPVSASAASPQGQESQKQTHPIVDAIPLMNDAHPYSKIMPACLTSVKSPRCYSPLQMRRAYHIQSLIDAGITGKGQTIVIIDFYQSPHLRHDLHLFDQLFGLPDPHLTIYAPDGYAPFNINDPTQAIFAYETNLDVEWAHAIAPEANIVLVLSKTAQGKDVYSATKFAIQNNLGSVISQSFGAPETSLTPGYITAIHALFKQACAQGMSVFASSGDAGAYGPISAKGHPGKVIALSPSVNYPASDPLVTGVGGTRIVIPPTAGWPWETVWSNARGASGGGFSRLFARPAYQDGIAGIGATRGVPDIAYSADPSFGVPVVISLSAKRTIIIPIGGTSAGTPQWAAITVLGNQLAHRRLGFLNPAMYALAKNPIFYHRIFRDIVTGSNSVTLNRLNGKIFIPGYRANYGWDPSTGLGTPLAARLLRLLKYYPYNVGYQRQYG